MEDVFLLERFVSAQAGIYEQALAELQAGQKRSHWMWFIFPQVAGLGSSSMAARYAIHSRAEARAYLEHPLLGPRLHACTEAVNAVTGRSANQIFGTPDDIKFRSSMTLFAACNGEGPGSPPEAAEEPSSPFDEALRKYFQGEADPATLSRLR
ncbi:DUF1810 domain-containing protein [Acidipila sp. EB88]|nr:DUF1810 domain-containing protein [Acidipila sp. EB88]